MLVDYDVNPKGLAETALAEYISTQKCKTKSETKFAYKYKESSGWFKGKEEREELFSFCI